MKKKIFIILLTFCVTSLFSFKYSQFRINGLYGIIDEDKKIILQPKYDFIDIYDEVNVVIGYNANEKQYEVYNKSLKLVYKSDYLTFMLPTENTLAIKKKSKNNKQEYSVLNLTTGKLIQNVNEKIFNSQHGFRGGVGLAGKKIIDIDGKELLSDIDVSANFFSEGLIAVRLKNGKSGFVNKKGKFVINADFTAEYSDNGPKGYLMFCYYFHEGYALVEYRGKYFLYNKSGAKKEVPDNIEVATLSYNSGLALIRDKATGKYGYMNPDFEIVIPGQFTEANDFIGPYAIVTYQEKDAIVDTKGNIYFCEEFCK